MTQNHSEATRQLPSEELFLYAERLKGSGFFGKLAESELFAVCVGDDILYCRAQDKNGLVVYRGLSGLFSYLKAVQLANERDESSINTVERAFTEDCVKCLFVDRKELDDWDYRSIIFAGRKYRGKQAWPVFRRARPLRYPWYIDESDEKTLIQAMDAATEFAEMRETKGYWEIMRSVLGRPLDPMDMITGVMSVHTKIPMLVKTGEGKYDLTFQELPDHFDEHFTAPILSNDLEIARLRGRKRTDVTLQCAITCPPMSIRDEAGDAPYIPLALIMVAVRETPKSYVAETVAIELALDYEGGVGRWMSVFCAYIEKYGRPRAVVTNEYRTEHLLKKLCAQLGIRFTYQKGALRELDDAIRGLQDHMLNRNAEE
jgi:hypothetical protein